MPGKVPARLFQESNFFIETGVPGNRARARFGMEGSVQTGPGAMKFWLHDLETDQPACPWDAEASASLAEGYLPLPKVRWPGQGGVEIETELTTLLAGEAPSQQGSDTFHHVQVRLFNTGTFDRKVRLMCAAVPAQGEALAARLPQFSLSKDSVQADGKDWARFSQTPDFVAFSSGGGLEPGESPGWQRVANLKDTTGKPSHGPTVFCAFDFTLKTAEGAFARTAPGGVLELVIAAQPGAAFPDSLEVCKRKANTLLYWHHRSGLDRPGFQVPHRVFSDVFRSSVAALMLACPEEIDSIDDLAWGVLALHRAGQLDVAARFMNVLLPRFKGAQPLKAVPALIALADGIAYQPDRTWVEKAWLQAAPLVAGLDQLLKDSFLDALLSPAAKDEVSKSNRADASPDYQELCWAVHGLNSAAILASAAGAGVEAKTFEEDSSKFKALIIKSLQEISSA
ncbi:MAG: hypothetical protein KJ645_05740, partial [Planctomycetes bacterium]|nr:hypothetical protein [Planctomycetota bacterium]